MGRSVDIGTDARDGMNEGRNPAIETSRNFYTIERLDSDSTDITLQCIMYGTQNANRIASQRVHIARNFLYT